MTLLSFRTLRMTAGDTLLSADLSGEPGAIFRTWRSALRDMKPQSASVSLRKRSVRGPVDPYFRCEKIVPAERKRADLSLSEICTRLGSDEIGSFNELHDILWAWMNRREEPRLDQPKPAFVVRVTLEGSHEVISGLESLPANGMLNNVSLGLVYRHGSPRVPRLHWLPDIASNNAVETRASLQGCWQSLDSEQASSALQMLRRIEVLFERKAAFRRGEIKAKANRQVHETALRKRHGRATKAGRQGVSCRIAPN